MKSNVRRAVFLTGLAAGVALAPYFLQASKDTHGQPISVSALNGKNGFSLSGASAGDQGTFLFPKNVSAAGDFNGDGYGDVIIGAENADAGGEDSGRAYVVFGRADGFPASFELSSLLSVNGGDGSDGFALNGANAGDHAGYAVAAGGDVNGDGFDDLIVGANGANAHRLAEGQSYVVFGQSDGLGAEFDLEALQAANGNVGGRGFVVRGMHIGDHAGSAVAGAGDVNGDGYADVLIGACYADPNGESSGQSYLVFGKREKFDPNFELSGLLPEKGGDGTKGVVINGAGAHDHSGCAVAGAGDVNGDHFDDMIVGAYLASPNGPSSGASYIVFGRADFDPEIDLRTLLTANGGDGRRGFVVNGIAAGNHSGFSVSSAGDINGDGFSDVAIGAPDASPNGTHIGQVYIIFGRTEFEAQIELRELAAKSSGDDCLGLAINGGHSLDLTGSSVGNAGDANADGINDLIIGAPWSDTDVRHTGRAYVIFGRRELCGTQLELRDLLAGSDPLEGQGLVINGAHLGDQLGHAVSSAGDVNHDGVDDVIVNANGAEPNGKDSGRSYVIFGAAPTPIRQ